MVSIPPVSPPRPYTLPSPHPYVPHTQPISFFSILSPAQYWVRSRDHLAPRYAIEQAVYGTNFRSRACRRHGSVSNWKTVQGHESSLGPLLFPLDFKLPLKAFFIFCPSLFLPSTICSSGACASLLSAH